MFYHKTKRISVYFLSQNPFCRLDPPGEQRLVLLRLVLLPGGYNGSPGGQRFLFLLPGGSNGAPGEQRLVVPTVREVGKTFP